MLKNWQRTSKAELRALYAAHLFINALCWSVASQGGRKVGGRAENASRVFVAFVNRLGLATQVSKIELKKLYGEGRSVSPILERYSQIKPELFAILAQPGSSRSWCLEINLGRENYTRLHQGLGVNTAPDRFYARVVNDLCQSNLFDLIVLPSDVMTALYDAGRDMRQE